MYSNSRGSLKIKSKDPFEKPSIRFNYLSTEDKKEWVEAIRVARNILSQKAMDPFNGGEISRDQKCKQTKKFLIGFGREMVKQHYTHLVVLKWVLLRIRWQ